MGATLVAVSPQLPDRSRELISKHRLNFEILRDEGNRVAQEYGLRHALPEYLKETYKELGLDLESSNGEPSWTLPLPARYIVGTTGVIRHAQVNTDYRFRPEPSETILALEELTQGSKND